MRMIFRETRIFSKQAKKLKVSAQALAQLKEELSDNAEAGKLIPDGGGLRKIRIALGARGKRGGGRVIYYIIFYDKILLTYMYSKSDQKNLTHAQLEALKGLTKGKQ